MSNKKQVPLPDDKENHKFLLTFTRNSLPSDYKNKVIGVSIDGKTMKDFEAMPEEKKNDMKGKKNL